MMTVVTKSFFDSDQSANSTSGKSSDVTSI